MSLIRPVVLCGGAGSRLWPLSRPERPKPLLRLMGGETLLASTLRRFRRPGFGRPIVVCGAHHEVGVRGELDDADLWVEPVPRGTAPPVVAVATSLGADELMLVIPADHHVARPDELAAAVLRGATAARAGRFVTFGIAPDRAEVGYGWIEVGRALSVGDGVHAIERFVEKPSLAVAEALLRGGGHAWNSGMFLLRAGSVVIEARSLEPDLLEAVASAVSASQDGRLDATAFASSPSGSFDVLFMERVGHGAVVPVDIGWDDLGTWGALARLARNTGRLTLEDPNEGWRVDVGSDELLVTVDGAVHRIEVTSAGE